MSKRMKKFIYVNTVEDRDKLIEEGYKLIKSDDRNCIYILLNSTEVNFALNTIPHVLSDTISF